MKKSIRAGGIVVNSENKIALSDEHLWGFPRGGVKEGEDYITAAIREVEEEVGLKDFKSVTLLGVYERYPHGVTSETPGSYPMEIHMFLMRTVFCGELTPKDNGVKEAKWYTYDEATKVLEDDVDRQFLIDNKESIFE